MKKKKNKVKYTQEQQLEDLEVRYGTNLNWVSVKLPLTFNEIKSYYGDECKEYDHLCACCNAWKEWHTNQQMVTIILERKDIIKALE